MTHVQRSAIHRGSVPFTSQPQILPAKIESSLASAVFPPSYNPCHSPFEPRALSLIAVHQGEPDEALAVPQHQLEGSRLGIQ